MHVIIAKTCMLTYRYISPTIMTIATYSYIKIKHSAWITRAYVFLAIHLLISSMQFSLFV